ncbi:hypothetical protein HS7_00590 [Sulfolobales archaeon HS-7]|nr:hypothetical protein HS7_00590 [Sulfolobales archaeon HS-7]
MLTLSIYSWIPNIAQPYISDSDSCAKKSINYKLISHLGKAISFILNKESKKTIILINPTLSGKLHELKDINVKSELHVLLDETVGDNITIIECV